MKASFNVLDQGWIPVVTTEGKEEILGIRETLARAGELQAISTASPLEEYGLYRFLGLFLMDALRPESETDIEDLCEADSFDMDAIEAYIALCRSEGVSFDLFDEERPFLQCKHDPAVDGAEKPVSVLDVTRASGNNHTHFDHRLESTELAPEKAVRLLLATYLFCTAAAQGYPSGVNASPPYFSVIQGDNLHETLGYTLLPLESIGIPFDEPPVLWRRSTPIVPKKEIGNTSWLQGMLFPTRRIHLVPDEAGNVCAVHVCQGENFVNKPSWHDPYVTYRIGKDGFFPMRPSADRAIWRNMCDIINIPGGQASQLLAMYHGIHAQDAVNLTLYGVETSNASYLNVYRHTLAFPLSLSNESGTVDALRFCISASETLANSLRSSLQNIESLPGNMTSSGVNRYYQMCEGRFWQFCGQAAAGSCGRQELAAYCGDISEFALGVFTSTVGSLNLRAAALAAVEKQRNNLRKSIQKLQKEVSS